MTWKPNPRPPEGSPRPRGSASPTWGQDAGQAAVIGLGVAVGGLALGIPLAIAVKAPFWIPPAAALGLGGLSFGIAAPWLVLNSRRLLWAIEGLTGLDIDNDRTIGRPPDPETLRVELLERKGPQMRLSYLDLPGDRAKLDRLAVGMLNGKGTAESAWTGKGNPFSRTEYQQIRGELIERGLAAWVNPEAHAQGWELTGAGRGLMRRLAQDAAPLPRGNGRRKSA